MRKEALSTKSGADSSTPTFPTDFFEHCSPMTDVDFGGSDLLHVYNTAQLKHRLNTTGLYVACSKQSPFSIEITNGDTMGVVVGVRILVGSQDIQKAPSCVDVFGRTIPLVLQRHRWFDVPLTKQESLQADKKLVLTFGTSNDPLGVTMIDSIKVYGKSKETFGWPDDGEEQLAAGMTPESTAGGPVGALQCKGNGGMSGSIHPCSKMALMSPAQLVLDQLVGGAVSLLDGSLTLVKELQMVTA